MAVLAVGAAGKGNWGGENYTSSMNVWQKNQVWKQESVKKIQNYMQNWKAEELESAMSLP